MVNREGRRPRRPWLEECGRGSDRREADGEFIKCGGFVILRFIKRDDLALARFIKRDDLVLARFIKCDIIPVRAIV